MERLTRRTRVRYGEKLNILRRTLFEPIAVIAEDYGLHKNAVYRLMDANPDLMAELRAEVKAAEMASLREAVSARMAKSA